MLKQISDLLNKIVTIGCDRETKQQMIDLLTSYKNEQYPEIEVNTVTVNKPNHYNQDGKKETIVAIFEDILEGELDLFNAYACGNIFKYVDRHSHKNGAEDLGKAIKYAEFLKLTTLRIFE